MPSKRCSVGTFWRTQRLFITKQWWQAVNNIFRQCLRKHLLSCLKFCWSIASILARIVDRGRSEGDSSKSAEKLFHWRREKNEGPNLGEERDKNNLNQKKIQRGGKGWTNKYSDSTFGHSFFIFTWLLGITFLSKSWAFDPHFLPGQWWRDCSQESRFGQQANVIFFGGGPIKIWSDINCEIARLATSVTSLFLTTFKSPLQRQFLPLSFRRQIAHWRWSKINFFSWSIIRFFP